jgi:hypothetical protein
MIAEKGRNSPCYVLDEYPAKNPMERLGLRVPASGGAVDL